MSSPNTSIDVLLPTLSTCLSVAAGTTRAFGKVGVFDEESLGILRIPKIDLRPVKKKVEFLCRNEGNIIDKVPDIDV